MSVEKREEYCAESGFSPSSSSSSSYFVLHWLVVLSFSLPYICFNSNHISIWCNACILHIYIFSTERQVKRVERKATPTIDDDEMTMPTMTTTTTVRQWYGWQWIMKIEATNTVAVNTKYKLDDFHLHKIWSSMSYSMSKRGICVRCGRQRKCEKETMCHSAHGLFPQVIIILSHLWTHLLEGAYKDLLTYILCLMMKIYDVQQWFTHA